MYAFVFHWKGSDFSQALSKEQDTKQINVSEVIIYQKTLFSGIAKKNMKNRVSNNRVVFCWLILPKGNCNLQLQRDSKANEAVKTF